MKRDTSMLNASVETMLRGAWKKLPSKIRKKAVSHAHPALVARFRRQVQAKTSTIEYGLLSVVIPVYNVENYLDACLKSIVSQSYANLEIIIVDDGSTDGSIDIARSYVRLDNRVRLIEKTNAGLGAARNTGIQNSHGDFIAFSDSDDLVPVKAYETMLASLHNSGSDFVVGSINRLRGKARSVPQWAQQVHDVDRIGINLKSYPDILHNVFAWNKIFRKPFFDLTVVAFPEGVLYEDQEATARAYHGATAFDVLSDVVYDWRIREDRSSITQQKDNIKDLEDRLLVTERLNNFMLENVDEIVHNFWLTKVLGEDLGQYYNQIPRVGDEYWASLQKSVSKLSLGLKTDVWSSLDVHHRILIRLIQVNKRDDFESVIVYNAENGSTYATVESGSSMEARPGYLHHLHAKIDADYLSIDPMQVKLIAALNRIDLVEPNKLSIEGFAYASGIDSTRTSPTLKIHLVDARSGNRLPLNFDVVTDKTIDFRANDAWSSYASAGFRAEIDFASIIPKRFEGLPDCEWYLSLSINIAGFDREFTLNELIKTGSIGEMPLMQSSNDGRYICRFSKKLGLSFIPVTYKRTVRSAVVNARDINISVEMLDGEIAEDLILECKSLKLSVSAKRSLQTTAFQTFAIHVPKLPARAGKTKEHNWTISIRNQDGAVHPVAWHGTSGDISESSPTGQGLRLKTTGYGYLEIRDRRWQIIADSCEIVGGETLRISGQISYADRDQAQSVLPRLALANGRNIMLPSVIRWIELEDRFEVDFSLSQENWGRLVSAPESGMYVLRCRTASNGTLDSAYWVPVSPKFQKSLPLHISTKSSNMSIYRTAAAGAMAIQIGPPLLDDERGKLMQSRLQREIPMLSKSPVEQGAVLFESFAGKTVGDSGLGLFNEMLRRGDDRKKYWTVLDKSKSVPEGATPVVMFSREWYKVLHTAEYLVNNNNFPYYFRKNSAQKYIQTWHGTPLKRIGNDISDAGLSIPYMRLMRREAEYWDYLLAQDTFASKVLPGAFDYHGRVLTMGYPRNDILNSSEADVTRETVRANLNLKDDEIVVLYVPTWRDNSRDVNGKYKLVNYLDVPYAAKSLGKKYRFLLRGHHNVSGQRYTTTLDETLDVTDYPDISELFLAADILVTDYSSVMFDFSSTGKPILFLAPDIEDYKDSVRGFYFDFESVAPGPISRSTKELVQDLLGADTSVSTQRYRDFTSSFASQDDGQAAQRVYDAIWNP